jgi:three-Cys-motif partner protein
VDTPSDELIAEWSKDKLDLLDKYLAAYTRIMASYKAKGPLRGYAYVDAFASVGRYRDQPSGQYVDGSPLVALKCSPPFDHYWFIERSRVRLQRLQERVSTLAANRDVRFRLGDANHVLTDEVIPSVRYDAYQRGLVFLDPYGLQVRWETVGQLAAARSFDVFMNLSTMGIARLLDLGRLPSGPHLQVLGSIMGDDQWIDELYATRVDLFGDPRSTRPRISHEVIASVYLERVERLFRFVSRPVVMKNSKGASLFVLFLASHNQTAVKITNDIFRRYELLRSRRW